MQKNKREHPKKIQAHKGIFELSEDELFDILCSVESFSINAFFFARLAWDTIATALAFVGFKSVFLLLTTTFFVEFFFSVIFFSDVLDEDFLLEDFEVLDSDFVVVFIDFVGIETKN